MMINYSISYNNPHRHYVYFELTTPTNGEERMQFQLAAWRPGRYELADFAQNIQKYNIKLVYKPWAEKKKKRNFEIL